MNKLLFTLLCLPIALMAQAQNADARFGKLLNESRWFELAGELKGTPPDSVHPLLYKMAKAMTYHNFNQPDSACAVIGDLLNNHQKELGGNTLSMAALLGMNLARLDRYAEAADLMQDLYDQLKAQGVDSTQTKGFFSLARQYRVFADNAPICKPLHPAGAYRVPMKTHNAMHIAKDKASKGHFITMDGSLNGKASTLVFDTGAGVNIISSRQMRDYGLRSLDVTMPMSGIGTQQGRYAMADTLRIGDMVWANVPFLVVDIQTGDAVSDSIGTLLPPVIGLPIMLRMQEIQLDFARRQFVVPATPTPSPLRESNLSRGDQENLRLATTDEEGQPLYFHFDTGGYETTLQPRWYERHKEETLAEGTPDSLRVAGVGAAMVTCGYRLPHKAFRLGNGVAVLDSVMVNTGIDTHSEERRKANYLTGEEDGTLGLDVLERFSKVILNLKDMYLEGIPY